MGTENKTGEVWRTRTVTGTEKIVLVVADHGAMAYVIHLAEEGTHTDIEVNCDGLRYGSSDRMYYVPSRSFEEYLRKNGRCVNTLSLCWGVAYDFFHDW
jgi:hypothetical protein